MCQFTTSKEGGGKHPSVLFGLNNRAFQKFIITYLEIEAGSGVIQSSILAFGL